MGPSELLPYFVRATEKFDEQDITLSTIVTSDRFLVLSRLASKYKGTFSSYCNVPLICLSLIKKCI